MFNKVVVALIAGVAAISCALGEETLVSSVDLPGASLSQEITYSTSKADYDETRDRILARLQAGDRDALVNPRNGPWMRVETTATIGFEYKGVGSSQGRKNLRQISAAEEALYRYEASQRRSGGKK
jgi:hypothetical protein